jgi:dinuclear metal center YbgI/SA1388 family protein
MFVAYHGLVWHGTKTRTGSVPDVPVVRDVVAAMDEWFPPGRAEPWDAVGLVCGDPDDPVTAVHLAVDCVPGTVREAVADGPALLMTHHPLLLGGVTAVPAHTPKGALVHALIRSGSSLFVAHTNADAARPGVSDALAARLGLSDLAVLEPTTEAPPYKLVVFVPVDAASAMVDALADAGAGHLGSYDRCAWTGSGVGTFRPGATAAPAIGERGRVEEVGEARVEMVFQPQLLKDVIAALRAAHPYEEPAFDVYARVPLPSGGGTGRVGRLPGPATLGEFVSMAAAALPATVWGVRGAGDPQALVRTVAVCGGSGGPIIEAARRAGADVYLSADLKHHAALEAVTEREPGGMALVDVAHWASEAPWLDAVADALRDRFGTTVDVSVSRLVTDPWTLHRPSPTESSVTAR